MIKRALLVGALVAALLLPLAGCGGQRVFTGYLVCQNCGGQWKCKTCGTDLMVHPEEYTLRCAKLPKCIVGGYGVMLPQNNGKYAFYPFDGNGDILALQQIVYKTKKQDGLLVEVRGTLNRSSTILVKSITEK